MPKFLAALAVSCAIVFGAGAFVLGTQKADKQERKQGITAARATPQQRSPGDPLDASGSHKLPKLKVEVAFAEQSSWQDWQSTLGAVKAANSISVKAAISGRINRVQKSGTYVKQGDILVQFDDEKERAQLDAKLAALDQARGTYERASALAKRSVFSSALLQSAETAVHVAEADVTYQRVLLTDFAILAPFAGVVGFHDLAEGQRIDAGQQLFPFENNGIMLIEFRIPITFIGKSIAGMSIIVELLKPGLSISVPVSIISPDVDTDTSTIKMRAVLPSETGLRPGMLRRVRYVSRQIDAIITLPDIALVESAYGTSVFVVGDNGIVQQRLVTVEGRNGGRIAVSGDLRQGDNVVVTGQTRLYPGAIVMTQTFQMSSETLAPSAKPNNRSCLE